MSKPMVTTLPWRMKPLERVRRIEIKSPAETPGFLLVAGLRPAQAITFLRTRAITCKEAADRSRRLLAFC
jgi:hypothetical protein